MNLKLEYRKASELEMNPKNWRRHPKRQREALGKILDQVGWAGAVLYNETTGRLIDGHLRRELAGNELVPVLIGQWTEEQEQLILATLDPIGAMAGTEHAILESILRQVEDDLPHQIFDGFYDFQSIEEPLLIDDKKMKNEQIFHCPKCGHEFSQ